MTLATPTPALTSPTPPPTIGAPRPPVGPLRPFTVEEYHRLIEIGVLAEDEPVELLEGSIVYKMPRNPPHDSTIDRTSELLTNRLGPGWRVRVQSAVTTGDSEPEPDVVVAVGPASRYDARHPGAGDVVLVVEVADSSLARDRDVKQGIYAGAGFELYWIVNLIDSRIEVYSGPNGPGASPAYRSRTDYGINDMIPLVVAGKNFGTIGVRELLPQ
jgi:hypothetical protein